MTLTREQVEWICSGSSAVKETLKQLADTDAALRQERDAVLGIFGEYDEPLPTLEQARMKWDQLRQQVVAYRERLEIGFAFDAITGERVECPEEELGTALDGIYGRDETIRGQDERQN